MYNRPHNKNSSALVGSIRFLLLIGFTAILLIMIDVGLGQLMANLGFEDMMADVGVGQREYEVPEWAQRPTVTPTVTPPAAHHALEAQAYLAEGRLRQAIAAFDEALSKEPDNDLLAIEQAKLLIYTRDTSKALDRAEQAMRLNPNNPQNIAYYCRALDWEGQYQAAFEACFCGIELYDNHPTSYAVLSEIYTDIGQWRNGVNYAEQALAVDYNEPLAHLNMGYALETQGKLGEAVEAYERAIRLAPNIAPFYISAGLVYQAMDDYRRYRQLEPLKIAISRFRQAVKLRPFDGQGYARLGWAFYLDGQNGRAFDALEQGVAVDPTYSRGWGFLAHLYYFRQRYEDATKFYPKAIDLSEKEILARAREIEIITQAPTLAGLDNVPILRGRFSRVADRTQALAVADLSLLSYKPSTEVDLEQNCAELIADSLTAETLVVEADTPITFTHAFSETSGQAILDLEIGNITVNLTNLPTTVPEPYQIQLRFWPDRVDTLGNIPVEAGPEVQIEIALNEREQAPIDYYYQIGLAYAYLEPPLCDEAVPWLVKSVEYQSAGWNPAWHGLRICPSASSPPTPIPTFTPVPTPSGS